jgi:beta-glucosidase
MPNLFDYARFLDPIILGHYPSAMRKILGPNLPEFTLKQKKILQTSKLDFIGLNHYSTNYLKDSISSSSPCELDQYDGDAQISTSAERDGILIGERVNMYCCNVNVFEEKFQVGNWPTALMVERPGCSSSRFG